ncbi:hypothetical protein Plec18167_003227 [Paecilomyces lecythidis]|uniref:Uncharacterized protein n=1 Tax=Paecilomyces lecythidis TaxID=3004212 RepID=A0ABR3Y1K3_9EURO
MKTTTWTTFLLTAMGPVASLAFPASVPESTESKVSARNTADTDLNKRAGSDCLVNAAYNSDWGEDGRHRFRAVFSSENTPTGKYCDYWNNAAQSATEYVYNVQCGYDNIIGSWRVDASVNWGSEGIFYRDMSGFLDNWRADLGGCRTG